MLSVTLFPMAKLRKLKIVINDVSPSLEVSGSGRVLLSECVILHWLAVGIASSILIIVRDEANSIILY